MKTSLNWLSDFISAPLDPQRAADAYTHGGLPVEIIERHGDDTVIDVEVTSNRSDCLSHVGLARELAALLDVPFKDIHSALTESAEPASDAIKVQIQAAELCPVYMARVIKGVKIAPSPAWLATRLEAVGVRPVNNVVDVTNYVMFEMGQPLHAFDFAKISGSQIIVRVAKPGEKLTSIDGKVRKLRAGMLVIADNQRPVALAGVMGGQETEVVSHTTDILLESARFDPLSVRRTARALAMKSDSSYRFERGIDPTLQQRASDRAAELILKTAGGSVLKGLVRAGSENPRPRRVSLRLARVKRVLGVDLLLDKMLSSFKRLGFSPVASGDRIEVVVPSHRLDIDREIDLIEEAARVIGYEQIPMREEISIRLTPPEPATIVTDAIAQTLVAAGYFEAVTFSFVSDNLRRDFLADSGGAMLRADIAVRKADASLRPSLIPGLLEAVRHNETAGTAGAKLFEMGSIFGADAAGQVDERRKVGLVGSPDLREVRGVVEAILARLDSRRAVTVDPDARAGFAKGACGKVKWGDEAVGFIGKIDRAILEKLSLRESPAAAELDLSALLSGAQLVPRLTELPRYPAVRRDVSLVLSESTRFESLQSLLSDLKLPFLETVEYVTTYRGKPLDAGTKSVTVTLVFRAAQATLTSEEVDRSVSRAVEASREKLGATLRA